MSKSGVNIAFEYNAEGLRVKKTANGVVTDYSVNGKQLAHLKQGSHDLHFFYDAQSRPCIVTYNGVNYRYVYNLQNDVIAIIDSAGATVVQYRYDAWGRILTTTGSMAATLGSVNPFRYRGYIFDEETGLYYLKSRYYNPTWGRFISPDEIVGVMNALLSHNPYLYCANEPVARADEDGDWFWNMVIGAAVGLVVEYVKDVVENVQSGKTGLDILVPDSPVQDYLAAAAGGAIAAIPGGTYVRTIAVGAAGNVFDGIIRGDITTPEQALMAGIKGGIANGVGRAISGGIAKLHAKRINGLPRGARKAFLQDTLYKNGGAFRNTNLRSFGVSGSVDLQNLYRYTFYSATVSTVGLALQ